MSTKTAPKSASGISQKQNPSTDYINKGIEAAENFANQGGKQPSAAQGLNDARKMAGKVSNVAGNPQMAMAKGAGSALMRGIRGNKNNAQEQTRRQKMQKELVNRGKKVLDSKVREAAMANAAETFGLSIVAYYAVKKWKVTIAVIASLFLVLFAIFDQQIWDQPPTDQQNTTPTSSEVCNPQQASYGQTSICTIKVSFSGSADDMIITSTILPGTEFVSAGQNGKYNKAANSVSWDAKDLKLPLDPIDITVTVKVRVTTKKNNVKVWNAYVITPVNLSTSASGGNASNLPANSNTCSGMYAHYMSIEPSHKNYGDPSCELVKKDTNGTPFFNKDAILKQLQVIKASEATAWFICVVPHESGYNANAYLRASTSGNGAYGLVQMNPTGKGNGKYDDGEVNWQNQLSNGINYNDKVIGHTFSYWPTSYDSCIRSNGVHVP